MNDPPISPSSAAEELLRRWIGLDPHSIGEAAIRRAVRLRMLALSIDDVPAYVRMVETDPSERDRLVEEVVVAESWFFRDPQVYEHLRRFVAARFAAGPYVVPLRILSVPCAAGEEPYSIAMALLDAGIAPERFRIDAIDVSRVALAKALAGRYSPNAFRNADGAFRDRWFRSDGGAAVLDESVRACVRFAWGNVLEESMLAEALGAGRGSYDVIFCRNLLIYLTPVARASVERAIDRLLKPDGIVVLGAAEPAILRGRWMPFAPGSTFTLKRAPAEEPSRPSATRSDQGRRPAPPGPRKPPAAVQTAPPAPLAPVAVDAGTPATPAEAERPRGAAPPETPQTGPVPADAVPAPATLAEALAQANALANARRFIEAIALCESAIGIHGPSPEVYFLVGMIHQTNGRLDLAEDCFHKTLYLDGAHADALLALSLLAENRGQPDHAEQYRRSARRVLERKGPT